MYEDIFYLKVASLKDVRIKPIQTTEIGLDAPIKNQSGKYQIVTASLNINIIAKLTGLAVDFSDGSYGYQIVFNNSQYGYIFNTTMYQWTKITETNTSTNKTEDVLNELITYNQQILENNLLCARGLELSAQNGIALPIEFRQQLYSLQNRLSTRNEKIKSSGYVQNVEERTSPEFSLYNQSMINFMNNPGIGFVISTTVAIIVTCILIAATAATAWALFKSMHTESKVDFNYSNNLLADLAHYLPPETFKKLMSENAANKKKADAAISAASGGGVVSTLKYLAIGYLGFTMIDKFLQKRK